MLKSRASLVVIDFIRTRRPFPDQELARHYADVKRGFWIHDYDDEDFAKCLETARFGEITALNLTSKVLPGVQRSARLAARALRNCTRSEKWKAHFKTCISLEPLLEAGLSSTDWFKREWKTLRSSSPHRRGLLDAAPHS